ncbi:hypothetical protein [Pseudoalteromonas sp. MMG022]|uniref:hypothetical protein n=1 Tax=Pseudoalteromonas sp. MMG022 TaxID=2909978 RepID=UPI001F3E6CA2|nr:hypothetical protein [Pseudoalteromonas sp. MMG022]MCF6437569.1 hypothetical protein [Pseudoalteromonas sp. MMG022]
MHNRLDFVTMQAQLNARLDTNSIALDGRDIRDRLAFVASLSELILFYDEQNQIAGDWRGVVLKDPVILLAVISKTAYQSMYFRFNQITGPLAHIKHWLSQQKEPQDAQALVLPPSLNNHCISQLLLLLDQLFETINSWVENLELSTVDFDLRDYILQQITGSIGKQLWQRLALQDYLSGQLSECVPKPSEARFSDFNPNWFTNKRTKNNTHVENAFDALQGLENIYQQVYRFFVQVIQSAKPAFYDMVVQQNDFPDTSLIIVANQLLTYSQQQFNQYSQKHLDFYYKTLLKQTPASAQPDYTYLCLTLNKSVSSYEMPQGTQFTAGAYPDKSPVLFASTEQTELNHASFVRMYGVSYVPSSDAGNDMQQYLQTFADSTKVRKSQTGRVLSSDWFASNQGEQVQQGFALASDMLFLNAGNRTVTLTLTFSHDMEVTHYQNAQVAVSCAKGWVDILPKAVGSGPKPVSSAVWSASNTKQLQLTLKFSSSFEAITTFSKPNADFPLQMPYCKVMLPNSVNLQSQPRLLSVKLHVLVEDSELVALSNDNGLLTNNKAMYLLGTRPQVDSHFYLSYPEAFAKPVTSLKVRVDWDNVPEDFSVYYDAYNDYIGDNKAQVGDAIAYSNDVFTVAWSVVQPSGWQDAQVALTLPAELKASQAGSQHDFKDRDVSELADLSNRIEPTLGVSSEDSNASFASESEALSTTDSTSTTSDSGGDTHNNTDTPIKQINNGLFAQHKDASGQNINAKSSEFVFTLPSALQCANVKATDTASNKNPSIRMTLTAPSQGFGEQLYGAVVNNVSLQNAQTLIAGSGLFAILTKVVNKTAQLFGSDKGKLKPMPNAPLQLQAKRVAMSYEAEQTIQFTSPMATLHQGFALQHIGPWQNYLYFYQQAGQQVPSVDERHLQLQPIAPAAPMMQSAAQPKENIGLALYQGVSKPALSLYMQLEQVSPPCRLSIFVELAQDISGDHHTNLVDIFYWSNSGWQAVNILADETRALTRSGIIELDLAQDVALDSPIWPKPQGKEVNTAWLMLTQEKPRQVQCVYCNTQAVKVQRCAPISLPLGTVPSLAAEQVKAPALKTPAISKLVQPFASMVGRAAQNTSQFEQRVSQRLKTKNRASSDWDYCLLAKQAYSGVFYVKRLTCTHAGTVRLGVVQQYTSPAQANAFVPVMPKAYQLQISDYLSSRVSAMTQVEVCNLAHEIIVVSAELVVSKDTNINDLNLALTLGVNVYLAPWIKAEQPQYCLNSGLSKAGLAAYIASFKQVEAIQQLAVSPAPISFTPPLSAQNKPANEHSSGQVDTMTPSGDNAIFVPASDHNFTFLRAGSEQIPEGDNSSAQAVSLPVNTLLEAGV